MALSPAGGFRHVISDQSLEIPDRVPRELAEILRRAMAWRPSDRYATVDRLIAALDTYQLGGLLEGINYTPQERLAKLVRAHPLWVVMAGAAALVGLLLVLFGLSVHGQRNELARQKAETDQYLAKVFVEKTAASLWQKDTDHAVHFAALALAQNPPGKPLLGPVPYTVLARWGARGRHLWSYATGQPPTAMHFDGTGERLVIGGADGTLRLHDLATGQELKAAKAHAGSINQLIASGDRRTLYTAGGDGAIRAWSMPDLVPGATLSGHHGPVRSLAIRSDDALLASAGADDTLRLWDLPAGKPHPWQIDLASGPAAVSTTAVLGCRSIEGPALAMVPESPNLWVAYRDGLVQMLAAPASVERYAFSSDHRPVQCLAATFHRGDERFPLLAFVRSGPEGSKTIQLENLRYSRSAGRVTLEQPVRALAFSSDGRALAAGCEGGSVVVCEAVFRDTSPCRIVATLVGHRGPVTAVAFSGDDRLLGSVGADGTVRLWDVFEDQGKVNVTTGPAKIHTLAFDDRGRSLTAVDAAGQATTWELTSRRRLGPPLSKTPAREPGAVPTVPPGPVLEAGAQLLADTGSDADDLASPELPQTVTAGLVSPDQRWLLVGGASGRVALAERSAGAWRPVAVLDAHPTTVTAVALDISIHRAATAAADGTVRLWHTEGFESPDGWLPLVESGSPYLRSCVQLQPTGQGPGGVPALDRRVRRPD
ncbi:MAG: hypothetical protein HY815_19865 [Candidatus Riflebacteria bacterium]|nr:hypothetical protein [Candidatus Riflebacteria bacterium]